MVKAYSNAVSVSKPRVFSPTSSPSSQPRTELVDEGIQTNPLGDQSNDFTYMDNEFIQQTQSSQFSVGISDSSLEPGELHLAARCIVHALIVACLPALVIGFIYSFH